LAIYAGVGFVLAVSAGAAVIHRISSEKTPEQQAWGKADTDVGSMLLAQVPALVSDNFSLSAANGVFIHEPRTCQPIHELAVWIFTQKLGASLQPMMKISGVQAATFACELGTIEVVPAERADDTYNFRTIGSLHLAYIYRAVAKTPTGPQEMVKTFGDDIRLRIQGVFDPSTKSIRLDSAEPL
jgi:hypothetical protein